MSKIDSIQISGTVYEIQDSGATKVVNVTQAEYDALVSGGTVDPTVLYNITDAQAADLSQYWTSAQTNSAITQAVSGKANSSDVYLKTETSGATELSTAFGNKQDTLSAGTGIDITDNVISATGGGGGGNVVQTTGTSTTDVMSQDAVTTQLNGKGDAISLDVVGSPRKKVTFLLKRGGINGKTISSRDLTLGRGLVYGEEGISTLSTSGLVETSAITTSVSSSSTDAQIPSAKAVYNAIQEGGGEVSSAITSGDTNAVAGGAVYDKFDEVEQVTAAALNNLNDRLSEDEEVTAAALNALNDTIGDINTILQSI